jgi:hypothetical protein
MNQLWRRRPGRGTVGLALTVVMAVLLLLWGTDWVARRAAESLVARALQEQTGTFDRPTVEVRGFFFLPQVLRGRYEEVDIAMEGITSGPLRIESVEAELRDVYLSFHDLLYRNTDRLLIAETEAEAFLTYEDLNRYLEVTGRPLTVEAASSDELRITGSVDVLGETLEASADAALASDGAALVVQPTRVDAASGVDGVGELLLGQRFTFRVPLDPLPFAQEVTDIDVQDSGVLVGVSGTGVVLDP